MRSPARAVAPSTSAAATATASTSARCTSLDRAAPVVGRHERVAVVGRRHERLLDRARADPADQVPHRAGLVVRSRRAGAAERLLPDDRAGRLVVNVEVAGRIPELLPGEFERVALLCEYRSGQPVRRALVDEVE